VDSDRDAELLSCFWQLHTAVLRRDGLEQRFRSGQLDADVLARSMSASEQVLAARTALYRHLMDLGWKAPDTVVRDVTLDEDLLEEISGSLQG
jgi:hypothetical protein